MMTDDNAQGENVKMVANVAAGEKIKYTGCSVHVTGDVSDDAEILVTDGSITVDGNVGARASLTAERQKHTGGSITQIGSGNMAVQVTGSGNQVTIGGKSFDNVSSQVPGYTGPVSIEVKGNVGEDAAVVAENVTLNTVSAHAIVMAEKTLTVTGDVGTGAKLFLKGKSIGQDGVRPAPHNTL